MKIRTLVEFTSTLPDDGVEDEEGYDFVKYPGENVAQAMAEVLARIGCMNFSTVGYRGGGHGWDFTCAYGKVSIYCEVNTVEDYFSYFLGGQNFLDKLFNRFRPDFVEFLRKAHGALVVDERFLNVRWHFPEAFSPGEPGGAPQPVMAD